MRIPVLVRTLSVAGLILSASALAGACGDRIGSVQTSCCGGRTVNTRVCIGMGTICADGTGGDFFCSVDCDLFQAGACDQAKEPSGSGSPLSLIEASDRRLIADTRPSSSAACGLRGEKLEQWIRTNQRVRQ